VAEEGVAEEGVAEEEEVAEEEVAEEEVAEEEVAEEGKVAAHFYCSGSHPGEWTGRPPPGRRFQDVDEIQIFRGANGKLTDTTGARGQPQPDAATRPRRMTPGGHRVATNRRLEDRE
jgi:SnoaL-like polyketide cyclase